MNVLQIYTSASFVSRSVFASRCRPVALGSVLEFWRYFWPWDAASFLSSVKELALLWLLITVLCGLVVVSISVGRRSLLSLKQRMMQIDSTLPLPLYERRRKQEGRFRLRLTKRQISVEDGRALDKLNLQIDGLMGTHKLQRFKGIPEGPRPLEFFEVEALLRERAELLARYPPLPSFSYLIRRRLAYLMIAARSK